MAAGDQIWRATSIIHASRTRRRWSQIGGVYGFGRRRISSRAKRLLMITEKNILKESSSRLAASAAGARGNVNEAQPRGRFVNRQRDACASVNVSENILRARGRE